MGKISKEMIEECFSYGIQLYENKTTLSEAKMAIQSQTGMDPGSITAYLHVLQSMLEGIVYKRTINFAATTYYLENIKRLFGEVAFRRALTAINGHAEYYATLGNGHQRALEKLVRKYS